jgi:hypothetical protein
VLNLDPGRPLVATKLEGQSGNAESSERGGLRGSQDNLKGYGGTEVGNRRPKQSATFNWRTDAMSVGQYLASTNDVRQRIRTNWGCLCRFDRNDGLVWRRWRLGLHER